MLQDPTSTRAGAGSVAPGWRTNPTEPTVIIPAATLALLVAPSSGAYQVASEDYVVAVDGASDGDVIITPVIISGGTGTFTPATATVNSVSALYDTFTFTPDSVAEYVLGLTNNRGLGNPANFGYSSQNPAPPALDLSASWVTDLHPLVPFGSSHDVVPAGCADHAGEINTFNLLSEYASPSGIKTKKADTTSSDADGTLDADSWTRNAYETFRIIDDVDEGTTRKCFSLRIDKTASGWTTTGAAHRKVRAQINTTGSDRLTRDWGLDTWFVTAVRIPATMKSIPPRTGTFDWIVLAGYHTAEATAASETFRLDFRGGGPSAPENAELFLRVHHQPTPGTTAAYTQTDLPLIPGLSAATAPLEVPADTWIYLIVNHRMWHGYTPATTDLAADKIPTGEFYVRPYIAIADGPAVPKTPYNGLWGIPYPAGSVGWQRPHYPKLSVYTNPTNFSDNVRHADFLGMQEYLVSDNPDPVNYPVLSAQHILDAFKASRLVTP